MRRTLSLILVILLTLGIMPAAFAEDNGNENSINYIAELFEGEEFADRNMKTLRQAFDLAEEGKSLNVMVAEPGTYYVGDGRRAWRLRSHTVFDLNGATLIRYGAQGNIIQNCDYTGENGTVGGYDLSEDITVKNGTIDGAAEDGEVLNVCNFGHAAGIHLENLNFRSGNSHLVEFSGCRDCTVTNCTFTGFCPDSDDNVEALQFDITDNSVSVPWNGVYFSDSTPCRNCVVENCTFLDYPTGVGNHKGIYNNHNEKIIIRNCKFLNSLPTHQPAVWTYDFDDSEVSGNIIKGNYGTGIYVSACRNTSFKNNQISIPGVGMYITMANSFVSCGEKNVRQEERCINCVVSGNTIQTSGDVGVRVYSGSGISDFNNNSITAAGDIGLTFSSGSTVTNVKNNTINAANGIGLLIATTAQTGEVSGNKITSKDIAVQVTSEAVVKNLRNNPTITSSKSSGIFVSNATVQNITGNTIKNCGEDGILITSTGKTSAIDSNTITGCTGYGVRVNNAGLSISFSKNSFSGNKAGTYKVSATILKATPIITSVTCTYDGAKIVWGKVSGAEKYRVFYKQSGKSWTKLADTTATSYVDAKAPSGVTRTYTVRCISANGKTYTSNYDTVGKSLYYVAAPRMSALQNLNGSTQLTWKAVAGAAKYRVFVRSGSSWKKLADTKATSYKNTAVKGGTTYIYTVRALNANGQYASSYNSTGWKYTYIAPPALPALKNTKNGVQLTFKKPAGGTYLRIFRKTGNGKWTKLADTSATSFVDKTAKNGTKYTYTLRVVNKAGTAFFSAYNTAGRTITCKR